MSAHRRCRELLPWYVNGTLGDDEARLVENHLAECDACRRELTRCRAVSDLYDGIEADAPTPHPSRIERLWTRTRAPEPDRPFPWRGLALVEAAALVVVLLVVGWTSRPIEPPTGGAEPAFRTLGAPGRHVDAASFRVVFAPDTPEETLRAVLHSLDARIVDGPSPLGVYTVSVPRRDDLDDWGGLVAKRLRAEDSVLLVEPSTGGPGHAEPP